ncbi:MAG: hypothetical protein AAFQ20_05190, partial [Bacteroidota bacterium]
MKHISAIIFGIAIVLAAFFLGNAYVKRAHPPQTIRSEVKFSFPRPVTEIIWGGCARFGCLFLRKCLCKTS